MNHPLVTDVRVTLADPAATPDGRLVAYADIVLADAVKVRGLRVIRLAAGDRLILAMPGRKASHPCPDCRARVDVGDRFCRHCRAALPAVACGRRHLDVAHPIREAARAEIERAVLAALEHALWARHAPVLPDREPAREPARTPLLAGA